MSEKSKHEFQYFNWEDITATPEEREEAEESRTTYPEYHYRVKVSDFTLHLFQLRGSWSIIIDHFYLGHLYPDSSFNNKIPYEAVGTFENGEMKLYEFICNWESSKGDHLGNVGNLLEEFTEELGTDSK